MRVLVTGATGFIGRGLCERLKTEAERVRGTLWSAEPDLFLPPGVEGVLIDSIGPETDWSEALKGIDTVVHLAARVHVMDETEEDPLAAYRRANVAGTRRLAREAAAAGVRRLVFLSSVKVLGEETPAPYTEDDPPAPRDPYGMSKREAEEALRQIAVETGLEIVIIRPPLVYGPGVKANFLRLLRMVDRGWPLPFGSIDNARSLIYVKNLIDAIAVCVVHPAAAGETFLVSDGEDVSTPELVRRVAAALGLPARLFPFPQVLMLLAAKLVGKTATVERLQGSLTVDSGKIRRTLGWAPPFSMAMGLRTTAVWYRDRMIYPQVHE